MFWSGGVFLCDFVCYLKWVTNCWLTILHILGMLVIFLSCWSWALMTIASLLSACAGIWSLLRNSSLSSNWVTFFTLCWDVQGNDWFSIYDASVKFITLQFQLNWSGFVFSFNSDTLKSTHFSCLFVLWSDSPLLVMPCGA